MAVSDYAFTKPPITKVYNYTEKYAKENRKKRRVVANLLMGEWVKKIKQYDDYHYVRFRGGNGVIKSDLLSEKRLLELYFIDVGQGDSILVQTPKDRRILIDGGRDNESHSFLQWKYNLAKKDNKIDFDALIMTHADEDHAKGLNFVLNDPKITVKTVYHNGIPRFKGKDQLGKISGTGDNRTLEAYDDVTKIKQEELSPDYKRLVNSILKAKKKYRRLKVKRLDQFSKKLSEFNADKLTIKVLGPINRGTKKNPKLKAIGGKSVIINGNSVALMLEYGKCKILLCGDMNTPYEKEFLKIYSGSQLQAHVFKANHHGSQDFTEDFLNAVQPWATVISSGDEPDYGHPRAVLLGSLGRYAPSKIKRPLTFSTEIVRTFKEIKAKQLKAMNAQGESLYEKTIKGIIHVRTNGSKLVMGRIFGASKLADPENHNGYQWEYYLFDLNEKTIKVGNPVK